MSYEYSYDLSNAFNPDPRVQYEAEAIACNIHCIVTKRAAGEFITDSLEIVSERKHLKTSMEKVLNKK